VLLSTFIVQIYL